MSISARSRWVLAAVCAVVPAMVALTACSKDSATAPKAAASVDTVALDQSTAATLTRYVNVNDDSGYYANPGSTDGDYVQDFSNSGNRADSRLIAQFPLPKLAGQGVVDSARAYAYLCERQNESGDSIVVDHVSWGATFTDSATWGGQTIQANVGTLVSDTTLGWKSVTLTSSVQADYAAKRVNSQYRIQWANQSNGDVQNFAEFVGSFCGEGDENSGASGPPYMIIWSH